MEIKWRRMTEETPDLDKKLLIKHGGTFEDTAFELRSHKEWRSGQAFLLDVVSYDVYENSEFRNIEWIYVSELG